MKINFQVHYLAEYGQSLCIIEAGNNPRWTELNPLKMDCYGHDFWIADVNVDKLKSLQYRYAVRVQDGSYIYEVGEPHTLTVRATDRHVVVRDSWQSFRDAERPFYSVAFMGSLFRRKHQAKPVTPKGNLRLSIDLPQILPTQGVAVVGNIKELGNWNTDKKFILSDADFPVWRASLEVTPNQEIEYKYLIYDLDTDRVVDLEWGENRHIWGMKRGQKIVENDRNFRRTQPKFKGTGVAIPVFSLRTEEDFGIGEFLDLKKLAEWAALTGQKMIQMLPINDTTLTHTNTDSYPYNAVSVFALHPIYINIEKMGKLTGAERKKYKATQAEFNAKKFSDYQCVYNEKMKYFRLLFKRDAKVCFESEEYKIFFEKNASWLVPYAEFLSRRDREKKELFFFLQFHAGRQLADAVAYAHRLGIAIKGDIPIGISPDSVDAYTNPDLFNLNASAGAPPDDFSISGQNWGFPTYNWDEMAKDNYLWWRQRFTKMQDYFDAYRIDHILGFFRIWQMRKTDVWGLCGHFSPAMPYSLEDLSNMGIKIDEDRMTRPYIRSNFLGDVFGYDTEIAKASYLNTHDGYVYFFRPEFDTQVKVQNYFKALLDDESRLKAAGLNREQAFNLCQGLIYLHCEVLFVRDQKQPELLHPRISIYQSHSFNELYQDQKDVIMNLYNDYFFHRHNAFWKDSAMRKLPTLIHATGMLCCGEDLGMVPDCVPEVMHELQILSLEIQRMPKNPKIEFAHPADAPYMSVCTTGTHDTNPLRAWWEENREVTQHFYNNQMGWWGEAPKEMTPEIAEFIINQHMYSQAMWVILPLQDWMAMDAEVRYPDQHAERINIPANPRHFWNYRMHLTLEELLKCKNFNEHVKRMTSVR